MDLIILLIVIACILDGGKRPRHRTNSEWNTLILLCCPLFWPFLIIRWLMKDKTNPPDSRPYDYEEHCRRNGK